MSVSLPYLPDSLSARDIQSLMLRKSLPAGLLGAYLEPDAPFFFVNERMLELLGYDTQEAFLEAIGGLLVNVTIPDDRPWMMREMERQILSGVEECVLETRFLRADGSPLWVMTRTRAFITETGRPAYLQLCLDITEQKDLENQLTLYRLASQGGTFVVNIDKEFTLVYGNDIFFDVIGYTPDVLRTQWENSCAAIVLPPDRLMIVTCVENAIAQDEASIEWEMRVLAHDGTVRWILVRGAFEFRESGRVLNGFITDVNEQHLLAEEIRRSDERYQIALREAKISVWEYDVSAATLTCFHVAPHRTAPSRVMENVPHSLLKAGIVHPDSACDLIDLYRKISDGAPRAEADLRNCTSEGTIWWEHLTFVTVFNEEGNPVRAVGVGEDITRQKEAEINYQRELQTRDTFSVGFVAGSRANLTKNSIEFIQTSDATPKLVSDGLTYDAMAEVGANSMSNADDRERYYNRFSRQALLDAFAHNHTNISMDYRRKATDGKISWVNATARIVRDALTGDVYSYSSIQDISEKKALELALRQRAERDSLTGAYNKETMIRMMQDAISASRMREEGYAAALFHIDHFNLMVQTLGYAATDSVVRELHFLLEAEMPEPKILGRMFGDELLVFLGGNPDKAELCLRTERVMHLLASSSIIAKETWRLTVSAGLVLCEECGMNQQQLVEKVRAMLIQCRNEGGNRYAFYQPTIETSLPASDSIEHTTAESDSFVLRCASAFVRYESFAKASSSVLRSLLNFCGAQCTCLLEFEPGTSELHAAHEWLAEYRPERTLLLPAQKKKLYETCAAVLSAKKFHRVESIQEARKNDPALAQWMDSSKIDSFYAQSLEDKAGMLGYLIVMNPTIHVPGVVLLQTLAVFIEAEIKRRRLAQQQKYFYNYDAMTGLKNRNSYLAYLEQFQPDAVISMAVISMDINGLKRINIEFGHLAGDRLVCFLADQLRAVLLGWHLYRIAGDEFLAICENITHDATQQMLQIVREKVEMRYPGSVAMGWVWAETELQPEELVNQADESMGLEKQAYYKQAQPLAQHYDAAAETRLTAELGEGCYLMYLQPKALIADGSICGAEALVRYRDAQGHIVSPDRFIPQMERDGTVCHVDLFMFEQVCKVLKRWCDAGITPVPVSMNFSRSTLLAQDLIPRVEAIYQRYGVPRELVEIEITENLGSIERETIIRIGGELVAQNFHLALDDFGARYSNLSILSAMKLHVLKLDKSLVNDLYSNNGTRVVVKSFLLACRELDIRSVAEGVETKEQLETLRTLGCEYAQGYYFNKPIPVTEFERLYLHKESSK